MSEKRTVGNPNTGRTIELNYDDDVLSAIDKNEEELKSCREKGHTIYSSMFGLNSCITCEIEKDKRRSKFR